LFKEGGQDGKGWTLYAFHPPMALGGLKGGFSMFFFPTRQHKFILNDIQSF